VEIKCCGFYARADRHGTVLDNPPLPEELALDALLGALKLVAWSGNDALLPRGGDRGAPGFWPVLLCMLPHNVDNVFFSGYDECCPMTGTMNDG
jgi:hypothetical protein